MRRTRWLFLAAILGILASVGATYFSRKGRLEREAPPPPAPLESSVDSRSQNWQYSDNTGPQRKYFITAGNMRQLKDPSLIELEEVNLKLFQKEGTQYNLVRSAKAQYDMNAKTLYSDGDIEITLAVPVDGPPHGHILKIHSTGVTVQSETGKATTDRKAESEFDQGGGTAVGADYDPQSGQLHLHSQVALDWRGKSADSTPMHIETGEAYYMERDSKVLLGPWAKLTRDTLHMEAGASTVLLQDGDIQEVDTVSAHGVQDDPDRKVEFAADQLKMTFAAGMLINKILGDQHGRLVSTTSAMRTTVTADHLDLDFTTDDKESTLANAVATGGSRTESVPVPQPGKDPADTRILRSDIIRLKMRAGGKEIDNVLTDGPGTIDFVPNRAGAPKRFMKGDRIWIFYGAENRIQSVRSTNVSTRTDKPPEKDKPNPPPAFTTSKELVATFDPKTSDLAAMEQKTDFRYDEGVRHAVASRAMLQQQQDLMTLEGTARVWDDTGSNAADKIVMNQKSGDFTAEGHVTSMRQPDQKGNSSAILSKDEVMHAVAQRMVSTDSNQKIHYEGKAVAWQGANRVSADRLDIDRDAGTMEAHGNVVSEFVDKDKDKDKDKTAGGSAPASPKPPAGPIFTKVQSKDMVYTEDARVVDYTGGVVLNRPDMTVTSQKVRAYLKDADSDSSLDKAFADGSAKIIAVSEKLKRTRTGTSEHVEYYADDNKVILQGGQPKLVDTVKGQTQGKQLTWWANDVRLLVDGVDKADPVKSTIHKK